MQRVMTMATGKVIQAQRLRLRMNATTPNTAAARGSMEEWRCEDMKKKVKRIGRSMAMLVAKKLGADRVPELLK
jgi:hypothetical protein